MTLPHNAGALRKSASDKAGATAAVSRILQGSHERRRENDRKKSKVEKLEAQLKVLQLAQALGEDVSSLPQPAPDELERARADAQVDPQLDREIADRLDAAKSAERKAEKAFNAEIQKCLIEQALNPALHELKDAFESLRAALTKAATIHGLVFGSFAPSPRHGFDTTELEYGPAQTFLREFQKIAWGYSPYSIRPAWSTQYEWYAPYKMHGSTEVKDQTIQRLNDTLAEVMQQEDLAA